MKETYTFKHLFFFFFFLIFSGGLYAQYISNATYEFSCPCEVKVTYELTKAGDVKLSYSPTPLDLEDPGWLVAITLTGQTTGTNKVIIWNCGAAAATYGQFYYKLERVPLLCEANIFTPNTNAVTITVDANGAGSGTATRTLTFLTYNLGANPSLTLKQQMAYNGADETDMTVFGGWYQWGRNNIEHTFRCNPTPNVASDSRFTTTQVTTTGTPDVSTQFIYNSANWLSSNVTTLWGAGTLNGTNSGSNNPCPSGYRVPTEHEWALLSWEGGSPTTTTNDDATISAAVTLAPSGLYWVQVNNGLVNHTFTAGNMCGFALYEKSVWEANPVAVGGSLIDASAPTPLLFLPAAGSRNYSLGARNSVGTGGAYWSSSPYSATFAYYLYLGSTTVRAYSDTGRAAGFSVRCVAEP